MGGHEALTAGRYVEAARLFRASLEASGARGYTVPIALYCEAPGLNQELERSGVPAQLFLLRVSVKSRPCWGLYWGVFASAQEAFAAVTGMPSSLRRADQTPLAVTQVLARAY